MDTQIPTWIKTDRKKDNVKYYPISEWINVVNNTEEVQRIPWKYIEDNILFFIQTSRKSVIEILKNIGGEYNSKDKNYDIYDTKKGGNGKKLVNIIQINNDLDNYLFGENKRTIEGWVQLCIHKKKGDSNDFNLKMRDTILKIIEVITHQGKDTKFMMCNGENIWFSEDK